MDSGKSPEQALEKLVANLKAKGSVAVAFSGGVDSSVVAALAFKALGNRALAVRVNSLLQSDEQAEARRIGAQIGIRYLEVRLNELKVPGFRYNPPDRCYLCKKYRFEKLKEIAAEQGIETVADGTNTSDLGEYRPGLKAVEEMGIYSPLLDAGLSKDDCRKLAGMLDLPVAGKPASPCLATRLPYGARLTAARLRRIGRAEKIVKKLTGAKIVRVREHDRLARIELGAGERRLVFDDMMLDRIAGKLKALGYDFVTLDMEGYVPGKFDRDLLSK